MRSQSYKVPDCYDMLGLDKEITATWNPRGTVARTNLGAHTSEVVNEHGGIESSMCTEKCVIKSDRELECG